ncbi:treacle protein isoform X2 [Rhineura floridana]|uniref:treacle protein isoform X2 n=1 Tax=Rhineura floridana TaxID=261503 RepID=UPI002AC828CE|nr:treacle protein isoform X2 [Rhineura floridana]
MAAAAGGSELKELLALIHQCLVQIGYERAAKELLVQSGQKTFPSSPVPLRDIFIQWKKISSQTQKEKADEIKRGSPAKIRVADPESSSESSEEEAAKPIKSNLPVNNSSVATAESSSEDEDSSSEEEAVAGKVVKIPVTGNKAGDFLQLAAQKTNSFPGKGVAVAAVQAKGRQNKVTSDKLPTPAAAKAGQSKVLSSKPGPALQSPVVTGQNAAQVAPAKKAANAESSSSSSSESEEEKAPAIVKPPAPKPALKKAESSSEDSSDNSDSEEEETNAVTLQVKPALEGGQVNTTLAKSLPATAVPSKGNAAMASPAMKIANQTRVGSGNVARSSKPTDSSESSDSSDTEDEEPSLIAQTKSSGKTPQTFSSPVKNASSLPSSKAVFTPNPLKQMPKTSVTGLVKQPPPAKAAGCAKKAESSEGSESSSESEDEALPVPVSQKRPQIPQPSTGARQDQVDKLGTPVKAASSALKGKAMESESSSSSDSEDEMAPAAGNLPPPPSATKANAAAQSVCVTKFQTLPGPLQKAQESEDSSQDSSDESDSEEDTVFTQKPAQVTQKLAPSPAKAPAAKAAGAKSSKTGVAQPAGKGTTSPAKSAAASVQKASESSETDSSDSSTGEEAAGEPVQQQKTNKAAISSGKGVQAKSSTPDNISNKSQGLAAITGKVEQSPSKKALPAKPGGILKRQESSGSSSSSDSEEEAVLSTAQQVLQPAGMLQKQEVVKKPESFSEESSDEDQEASQSLLTGFSGPSKTSASTLWKCAAPVLSKQSSGKASSIISSPAISAFAKSPGKAAPADSSSSDSSNSDTDEGTVGLKAEMGSLSSSGREAVEAKVGKGAVAGKRGPGSIGSKAASAKKAAAKAQSNGKAKGTPAGQLPLALLSKVHPMGVSSEEAVARDPVAAAQEDTQATPVVAVKTPKPSKSSKAGVKEKPSKKRKLAAVEAGLGEPKGKKRKAQSGLEVPKKKKKKAKSSSSIKTPKKKDGKEKKSDKKKKKSKKLESLTADGLQKKKKKKKKTGELVGAA